MSVDELFSNAGFIYQYRTEMEDFYRPFFETCEELTDFFVSIFEFDGTDSIPRRMVNQVQRFVTLANDVDKIRPKRDPLRILFLKTCLDSLSQLAQMNKRKFYQHFSTLFSEKGEKYILDNFHLAYLQEQADSSFKEISYKISLCEFLNIMKTVRDSVVHDGNYWEMQLFSYDEDSTWHTSIKTKDIILDSYKYQAKGSLTSYFFETSLNYERFIFYFVETCIRFVQEYIKG